MRASFFIYAARASWQMVILAVLVNLAFQGMRNVPDVQELPLTQITTIVLGFMLVVGVVSGIVAIVGGLTRPLERPAILKHAGIGLGLWTALTAIGVAGYVAVQARDARANESARDAYTQEMAQIDSEELTESDRAQRTAAAMAHAADVSTNEQKAMFVAASAGMATRAELLEPYEHTWARFEDSGGVDPTVSPLKTRPQITARRDLLDDATQATDAYRQGWQEVLNRWQAVEDNELMAGFVRGVMSKQPMHERRLDCRAAESRELAAVLSLFDAERGRWRVRNDVVTFNRKKFGVQYRLHQRQLTAIHAELDALNRGEVPASSVCSEAPAETHTANQEASPEETVAENSALPKLERLEPNEAVTYAKSYVTLIRRGNFEEAYKYMPSFVASEVSRQEHAVYWTNYAGASRTELAVGEPAKLGDAIAYTVTAPDQKSISVAVLKIGGKVYTAPEAFLPE